MRAFVPTKMRVVVGRDASRPARLEDLINVDDVSQRIGKTRFFLDGALVGLWRSLRAHRVKGNLIVGGAPDPDSFVIAPSEDGSFVRVADSAATWAEAQSASGYFVLAPVILAYDTSEVRYLYRAKDASLASGNHFAVLLSPRSVSAVRALANQPDDGG